MTNGAERTRWKIPSDRTVDENPRIRLSIASLERCAMTVVLDGEDF